MTRLVGTAGRRLGVAWLIVAIGALSGGGTLTASASGVTPAALTTPVMKAGKANGPFPVVGGTHPAQVARLAVSSGNWTVFAKGLLVNTTIGIFDPRPVRCTLALGPGIDQVLASPIGGAVDSSREAFLLTLSVHLPTATSARLRCAAPGSTTGAIVVKWIRMVAFKTAGLSLGPLGQPYTHFGSTGSASQAYQVHSTLSADLPMNTEGLIAGISLPAGAWAITAKATVRETSSTAAAFSCSLDAFGDIDRIQGTVDGAGAVGDRLPIALEVVHVLGSAGGVDLYCQSSNGGPTKLGDLRITAYRTSGLFNKNLRVDPHFAAFASGVKPVVDAGFVDGPIPITPDSSFHPIGGMSLPTGKWVVVAKAYLDDATATGLRPVRCQLGDLTTKDNIELVLPPNGTIDSVQPLVMTWYGTFAARAKVIVSCRTAGGGVTVAWVKMIAYKAGTLQQSRIH